MLITTSWIEKNYNKFNNQLWGGLLPEIKFKTNRSKKVWGFATYRFDWHFDTVIPESITLSNYYDSPEDVKIQTLLHEMIHIADYFFHPEHFIRNGRKVSGRTYDPHGYWFVQEAKRITKESGYQIATHVTKDEENRSSLSSHSLALVKNKINSARIVVVYKDSYSCWFFKTDVNKINTMKNLIKKYLSDYQKVEVYTITDENMASRRSSTCRLRGWRSVKPNMINNLQKWGATKIESYAL